MTHSIRNDGEWPPILAWLDKLAGGRITVPFGMHPPLTRDPGSKVLRVYTLGGDVEFVPVGGYVTWDADGGFRAATEVPA